MHLVKFFNFEMEGDLPSFVKYKWTAIYIPINNTLN